ncbi:hypothetical protein Hanom_Chr06g00483311 [Helianthus anomalus]
MKLKHMEHEICLKTSRMSVRLAVRSRYSVNYDENSNGRENDPNYAMSGIFAFQSVK